MPAFVTFVRDELRRSPWIVWSYSVVGGAAFGTALPDLIAFAQRVLA